jgi:hypothetical protein
MQMRRQVTAIGSAGHPARRCQRRVGRLFGGLAGGNRQLEILERQVQLLIVDPFRSPTELCSLKLTDDMPEPLDLPHPAVSIGDSDVSLSLDPRRFPCVPGALRQKQGLEARSIVRKIVEGERHVLEIH